MRNLSSQIIIFISISLASLSLFAGVCSNQCSNAKDWNSCKQFCVADNKKKSITLVCSEHGGAPANFDVGNGFIIKCNDKVEIMLKEISGVDGIYEADPNSAEKISLKKRAQEEFKKQKEEYERKQSELDANRNKFLENADADVQACKNINKDKGNSCFSDNGISLLSCLHRNATSNSNFPAECKNLAKNINENFIDPVYENCKKEFDSSGCELDGPKLFQIFCFNKKNKDSELNLSKYCKDSLEGFFEKTPTQLDLLKEKLTTPTNENNSSGKQTRGGQ